MEIQTDTLKINFSKRNSYSDIFIFKGSTKVCAHGQHRLIVRTRNAVSDPVVLEKLESIESTDNSIESVFANGTDEYSAHVSYSKYRRGLKVEIKVDSPKPIWMVEYQLTGFDFEEILVPALGGQSISKEMPEGKVLSYKYPFWWNAQFVIGSVLEGGIILRSEDKSNDLKMLRVEKENDKFSITYGVENPAPIIAKQITGEFIIDGYGGDWKNGVNIHKEWMQSTFSLLRYQQHPHYPAWMDKISFILELWGARKGKQAFHTFDQMIDRIRKWENIYNPTETLLYLPGYAQNGVDSNTPNYDPSEQCGGDIEFKELVDTAHQLGYKVMIHTNVLAMTFDHPKYEEFKNYSVYDPWDRQMTWGLDIDGDWLSEPYFAYMNPGYKQWGDFMSEIIGNLIKKFNLDAVFLDQTLLAFNNSRGPNFIKGMHDHIKRLQIENPNILFAGEGINERVLPRLPVVQIHGIDSIAEVHGMDNRVIWRKVHPVSEYLFREYTRFMAHLLTKHPDDPIFKLQEQAYAKLNVIPALSLYGYEQKMDVPATHLMVERARRLKNNKNGIKNK